MESREFRGIWWSPEHRDIHIDRETDLSSIPDGATAGIVRYDPTSSAKIELFGELARPDGVSEVSYIHGMTTEGNKITISDCIWEEKNRNEGSGYFSSESWVGHTIFRHEHTSDSLFSEIDLSFPNLESWTNINTLDRDEEAEEYDPRRDVREVEGDEYSIKFVMVEHPTPHGYSSYPDQALLQLEFDSPLSYKEISADYIRPLQNFFTLGMNTPVFPDEISDGGLRNPTEIYPFNSEYSDAEETYPSSMFFTLTDVDFETAILEWFNHYENIETLHNLYFSTLYNDSTFLELEFLSLVIGLETYHRRKFPEDRHMEDIPYKAFRKAAEDRLPDVAAKSRTMDLLNSIGNDYSLGERLESVVSDHRDILNQIMDVSETVKQAKNLRHNLAHGLDSGYSTDELSPISNRLRAICQVLLLDAVGLSDKTIQETLTRYYRRHYHFKGEVPDYN